MSDRRYPISNHRLKRRAVHLMNVLRNAQQVVRENGSAAPPRRVLAAINLLALYGVHPTDELSVHRGRVFTWRVYRDPA